MFIDMIMNQLHSNSYVFKHLLEDISEDQCLWKSDQKKWSLLEVINHLIDEEILDFRQRFEFALDKSKKDWTRIEPLEWHKTKFYDQKNYNDSIKQFLKQRKISIEIIEKIKPCALDFIDNYPFGKTMTIESILLNWLAHDHLHIRQINQLKLDYLASKYQHVDFSYAGNW